MNYIKLTINSHNVYVILIIITINGWQVANIDAQPINNASARYQTRCTTDLDCGDPTVSNLICDPSNNICDCDSFTSIFDSDSKKCLKRVNFLCEFNSSLPSNSVCVKNSECLPLSTYLPPPPLPPLPIKLQATNNNINSTSSTEENEYENNNSLYVCTCKKGFIEDFDGGNCLELKKFNEACDYEKSTICGADRSEISCIDGQCQCKFGKTNQYYDDQLNKCISYEGGNCSTSCVPNSICVDDFQRDEEGNVSFPLVSLGLKCDCLPGFEKNTDRMCIDTSPI